jgi:hypothetical protein
MNGRCLYGAYRAQQEEWRSFAAVVLLICSARKRVGRSAGKRLTNRGYPRSRRRGDRVMRRREFITLLGTAAATWPLTAGAQQSVPLIGFLHQGSPEPLSLMNAFRKGLGEAGFIDGQNVMIQDRAKIALLKAQPVGQRSGPTVAPRLGVAAWPPGHAPGPLSFHIHAPLPDIRRLCSSPASPMRLNFNNRKNAESGWVPLGSLKVLDGPR